MHFPSYATTRTRLSVVISARLQKLKSLITGLNVHILPWRSHKFGEMVLRSKGSPTLRHGIEVGAQSVKIAPSHEKHTCTPLRAKKVKVCHELHTIPPRKHAND